MMAAGRADDDHSTGSSQKEPVAMASRLKRVLWHDDDLANAEDDIRKNETEREGRLYRRYPDVVAKSNRDNIKASLELAEAVAKAETERETNLNTRGATAATVAGLIVPIATALVKPVSTTSKDWTGPTRTVAEYFFLIALVFVASAMVMAVVGVLRPGRGGRTKNAVGEAVVDVWRQRDGDVAFAVATEREIAVFRLDHMLQAIPAWHYRNRSKARWLRRAWIFLMIGIIFIGSAGVIFITKLSKELNWVTTAAVIVGSLFAIWLLLWTDFIFAGRKQAKTEKEPAEDEVKNNVNPLGFSTASRLDFLRNHQNVTKRGPRAFIIPILRLVHLDHGGHVGLGDSEPMVDEAID